VTRREVALYLPPGAVAAAVDGLVAILEQKARA
jgi:hypothetical protein